jgi:hypothetical protein
MPTRDAIAALRVRLKVLREAGAQYFGQVGGERVRETYNSYRWELTGDEDAEALRTEIKRFSVDLAGAARGSALIAEADLQDLRHKSRQMLASVRFNRYRHQGVYIHHDEDLILGVDPPSQREDAVDSAEEAPQLFDEAAAWMGDLIDLLSPSESTSTTTAGTSAYHPNTAFIMMPIDKGKAELEDVKNAIKEVCKDFGIDAKTADDIEHDGVITDRVLEEIETNEFLIADLTGERPNVYYEIGHAHARNKRVMLYRRKGTPLHFDVAHRNCPDYANITELKKLLRSRLETLTNKPKKS